MSRKKTTTNTPLLFFDEKGIKFKNAGKLECTVCKKRCKLYNVLMKQSFTEEERDRFLMIYHKDPCPRCKKYVRFSTLTNECIKCRRKREEVERIEREYGANPTSCDTIIRIFASEYGIPIMRIHGMLEEQRFYNEVIGYEV